MQPTLAILGGTGKEGKGLAYRWSKAGYKILIGSRTPQKAVDTANELNQRLQGNSSLEGMGNLEAAQIAETIVLTVPFAAHQATLEGLKDALQGKLLIDVSVPLVPPKVTKVQMPPSGSATQQARAILGEGVEVCAAFQNISHQHLLTDATVSCDVLVTGTNEEAREKTLQLVDAAGLTGYDAGPIENSAVVEGLTSILIGINKKYGATHAGIKITGVKGE